MYAKTTFLFEIKVIFATFRKAEFGFLGVLFKILRQIPFF